MEAIPAEPLFQPFVGTRVNGSGFRHLSVKGSIEDGYLPNGA
jgi:hypothetical protein